MINRRVTGNWNGVLARVMARQHIRSVYQPIVRLADGDLAGYEALARPATVADEASVEEFFQTAARQGAIRDLDSLCRRAALDGARGLDEQHFLSLNLDPSSLADADADSGRLVELVEASGRTPTSVVVELVRPGSITHRNDLMRVLMAYRRRGLRLALAGIDVTDEPVLAEPGEQPDLIKLARATVGGIDEPERRALIERCARRFAGGGPGVVAEGIETVETLAQLRELGVGLGQGYLTGRPAAMDRQGRLQPETDEGHNGSS